MLTACAGVSRLRICGGWRPAHSIRAPASAFWRSMRSRKPAAPRGWRRTRTATRRRSWSGCTPTTSAVPRRSPIAAPGAAPLLPAHRSRPWHRRPHRPVRRRRTPCSRCRSRAPMDAAAPGRLGARALWPALLSRDDPGGPASLGSVLEEGQEAARSGRFRKAASLRRAGARPVGRCPTRPLPAGLLGRGAYPSGSRSRLWLVAAGPALLGHLPLTGPVGQALLLWALSLQRRGGAAVAVPTRQRGAHHRSSPALARRMARLPADRAVGRRSLSPRHLRARRGRRARYRDRALARIQPRFHAG